MADEEVIARQPDISLNAGAACSDSIVEGYVAPVVIV